MPRVIGIVPSVAERSSGPTYSTLSLTRNLIEAGMTAELAVMKSPTDPEEPFLRRFPMGPGPVRLGNCPAMLRYLRQQAHSHHGEIVLHNHGMWQLNALYPGWVARGSGVPLVTSPRGAFSQWAMASGTGFKKPFWSLLQHPALRATTCFHATAPMERDDIRRLGFRQPVAVLPNGIDLPQTEPRHSPDSRRKLLYLGRLHDGKGVDHLIQSWAMVHHSFPDWDLVIAGSDRGYYGVTEYGSFLRSMVAELEVPRVSFIGEVTGQDKARALAEADLYVLPSLSENFGITVAEALAAGLPVITTRGTPWQGLEREGAGWWIETGTNPLSRALHGALALPRDRLAAIGSNGRAWMARDMQWPVIARKMRQTFEWLLHPNTTDLPAWVEILESPK